MPCGEVAATSPSHTCRTSVRDAAEWIRDGERCALPNGTSSRPACRSAGEARRLGWGWIGKNRAAKVMVHAVGGGSAITPGFGARTLGRGRATAGRGTSTAQMSPASALARVGAPRALITCRLRSALSHVSTGLGPAPRSEPPSATLANPIRRHATTSPDRIGSARPALVPATPSRDQVGSGTSGGTGDLLTGIGEGGPSGVNGRSGGERREPQERPQRRERRAAASARAARAAAAAPRVGAAMHGPQACAALGWCPLTRVAGGLAAAGAPCGFPSGHGLPASPQSRLPRVPADGTPPERSAGRHET